MAWESTQRWSSALIDSEKLIARFFVAGALYTKIDKAVKIAKLSEHKNIFFSWLVNFISDGRLKGENNKKSEARLPAQDSVVDLQLSRRTVNYFDYIRGFSELCDVVSRHTAVQLG